MKNRQKQYQLKVLNYYKGKLDGSFGPLSKNATRAFQKDYNLKVDGSFGYNTKKKSKTVIKTYQTKLNKLLKTNYKIDGLAGPTTEALIKLFQKRNNLSTTGTLNNSTIYKINFNYMTTYENEIAANFSKFKNFKKNEFRCPKYCSGYPVQMKHQTIVVIQRARTYFNAPCTVSSGIRCKRYNSSLKNSSKNSKHLSGKAIDCSIKGVSGKTLMNYLKKQPEVKYTYIIKGNWVHFNIY